MFKWWIYNTTWEIWWKYKWLMMNTTIKNHHDTTEQINKYGNIIGRVLFEYIHDSVCDVPPHACMIVFVLLSQRRYKHYNHLIELSVRTVRESLFRQQTSAPVNSCLQTTVCGIFPKKGQIFVKVQVILPLLCLCGHEWFLLLLLSVASDNIQPWHLNTKHNFCLCFTAVVQQLRSLSLLLIITIALISP